MKFKRGKQAQRSYYDAAMEALRKPIMFKRESDQSPDEVTYYDTYVRIFERDEFKYVYPAISKLYGGYDQSVWKDRKKFLEEEVAMIIEVRTRTGGYSYYYVWNPRRVGRRGDGIWLMNQIDPIGCISTSPFYTVRLVNPDRLRLYQVSIGVERRKYCASTGRVWTKAYPRNLGYIDDGQSLSIEADEAIGV